MYKCIYAYMFLLIDMLHASINRRHLRIILGIFAQCEPLRQNPPKKLLYSLTCPIGKIWKRNIKFSFFSH